VPVKDPEQVLQLYRERYFDFNVQHFHEKLSGEHGLECSCTWVNTALQEAGLVERRKKRGSHRKTPAPAGSSRDAVAHRWERAPLVR